MGYLEVISGLITAQDVGNSILLKPGAGDIRFMHTSMATK
jgi:hypothetical protein